MKIVFDFYDSITNQVVKLNGDIENNQFTELFFDKVKLLLHSKKYFSEAIHLPPQSLEWNQTLVDRYAQNISKSIAELIDHIEIPYPIDYNTISFQKNSLESRKLLNFIHRTFTSFYKSKWTSWSPKFKEEVSIHKFNANFLIEQLQCINLNVHNIESYYYTEEFNSRYKNVDHCELHITMENGSLQELTQIHKNYRSVDYTYDIWLPINCMTGKNLLSCYIDFDNPNEFDIENENTFNGNISLGSRKSFITNSMKEWLSKEKVEYTFGLPLGRIVEKDKLDLILQAHKNYYYSGTNRYTLVNVEII